MAAATAASAVVLLWLVVGHSVARAGLNESYDHGVRSLNVLNDARLASLNARGNENLTLVSRGAETKELKDGTVVDAFDYDFQQEMDDLTKKLAAAADLADDKAGEEPVAAATGNMKEWKLRHADAREADDSGNYQAALDKVIGSKSDKPTGECFDGVDKNLAAGADAGAERVQAGGGQRPGRDDRSAGRRGGPRGAGRGGRGAGHRAQAFGVPVRGGAVRGGAAMSARRLRASLKGWGGVGAMAVACALTAVFALLLPLSSARGDGSTGIGGQGVGQGTQAKADECTDPQNQSLTPSGVRRRDDRGHQEAQDPRLIVGVDQNSYRWGYRDPNNTEAAATSRASTSTSCTRSPRTSWATRTPYSSAPSPPTSASPPSSSGKVDMVVRTMTITCARLEDVAFSAPYFADRPAGPGPQDLVHQGVRRVAGEAEDLHGDGLHRLRQAGRRQEGGQARLLRRHLDHGSQPTRLPGKAPAR